MGQKKRNINFIKLIKSILLTVSDYMQSWAPFMNNREKRGPQMSFGVIKVFNINIL